MQIETLAYGTIDIDDTQVVTMTEPVVGFPGLARYAILHPDPEWPFQWLQSVERKDVCFLIADPRQFFPAYRLELKARDLADLQLQSGDEAAVGVILTVPGDPAQSTANLLAPVVFNSAKKLARQVILEGSRYSVRTPLLPAPEPERACAAR